ncbi:hypothetical protein PHYSODRAFT_303512 [Phytophthora sojae]|uniref:Uncharacterized protein n=1 Tax=Phytophthora sojae (strain P6497) TaxID=1094619 RepID=G4ZS57_PHYSP|nr:hypothetical protein PHYSODRAFT_303512 [Phytophthora sojae]EGZ14353.1 hypothetical protein PHYSODRAFT_303512 [Phytophthora sojae]|eukprot:XP_009531782.1 hypothetical protein PHYSODRAFT_303512 [Phytophthora sojae]
MKQPWFQKRKEYNIVKLMFESNPPQLKTDKSDESKEESVREILNSIDLDAPLSFKYCKANTIEDFIYNPSSFIIGQSWFKKRPEYHILRRINGRALPKRQCRDPNHNFYTMERCHLCEKRLIEDEEIYLEQEALYEAESGRKLDDEITRSLGLSLYFLLPYYTKAKMNVMRKGFPKHKAYFKSHIAQELIAVTMHPNRIQDQMNQFDDIEQYFTGMGY